MKRLGLTLAATVCITAAISLPWAYAAKDKQAQVAAKNVPVNVEVADVTHMNMPQHVFSVGSLVALQSVTISSEVDGRVKRIFFEDGQFVKKGSAVLQLDSDQAKADLVSAKTELTLSKATYQRYLSLFKEGGVSRQDLDQKRSDMESKSAAVKSAIATLQKKTLVAPFSGRLGAFAVTEGNYIKAGDQLVKLVNKRVLKVVYTLPENNVPNLVIGQPAQVTVGSFPGRVFDGAVSFIAPSVDVDTRTVSVQATIPNPDEKLSPGMFVHVSQIVSEAKNALVIPEEAIIAGLQGDTVYKVVDGKAIAVKIVVGPRRNGFAQIKSGLQQNDQVVIAGQQKLHDGSAVAIVQSPSGVKHATA